MPGREQNPSQMKKELKSLRARVEELEHAETFRHVIQQALERSEQQLRQVVGSLPIVLISIEAITNRVLLLMGAVEEILGASPEDYIKNSNYGHHQIHPDDGEYVYQSFVDGLAALEPFQMEYRIHHYKDHRVVWLHHHVVPICDESGKLIRYDNIVRDVTSEKEAEESLRQSENRYRMLAESAEDSILVVGRDCRVQYINSQAAGYLRVSGDTASGKHIEELFPGETTHHFRECIEQVFESGQSIVQEGKVPFAGSDVWFHTRLVPMKDDQGNVSAVLGVSRDLTNRRRMEQALRERGARLRFFIEHTPAAVAMFDRNMRYMLVSARWLADYGVQAQDIIGKSHYEIFPETPEHWKTIHARCLAGASERCDEDRFEHSDGTVDWLRWEIHPWRDDDGRIGGIIMFTEVITDQKWAEEALRESESRFRMLTESSLTGVYIFQEGVFCYVNPALATMFGYTPDELIGKLGPQDLTAPEDQPLVGHHIQARLQGQVDIVHYEFRGLRKDGQLIQCEALGRRIEYRGRPAVMGTLLDITERMKSEAKLRMLMSGVEQSSEGLAVVDLKGHLLLINNAFAVMHGYDRDELIGRHFFKLHREEDVPEANAAFRHACESGEVQSELRHLRRDGTVFIGRIHGSLFRDETGKPIGVMATLRDVSDIKQAEDALRASEYQYRTTLDAMADAIHVADADLQLTLINNTFSEWIRQLGLTGPQLGQTVFEAFPFLPEVAAAEYQRVFETGQVTMTEETVPIRDQTVVTETRKIPIFEGDRVVRVVTVVRDITERKAAEQALRDSEALYRTLVETLPDGVVMIDLGGKILMANQRVAQLYGAERVDEMIGHSGFDYLAEQDRDRARDNLRKTIELGNLTDVAYELLRKDGTSFSGEVSSSVVTDTKGSPRGFIIVARDITERRHLQEQLLQSQKLESVGTLAGGVAHDFNNLLAVILGGASIIHRRSELTSQERDIVTGIMDAAERASALTQQLLAYARGGLQQPAPTDLTRIAKNVLSLLERTSPPHVRFEVDYAENLPPVVVDPTQIEQVCMNLCLNAIQASRERGVIKVSTGRESLSPAQAKRLDLSPGDYVFLRVRDQGCGMSAETVKRIFEPFFTTKPMGRGMGLAAAEGIVRSHKGQIQVDSKPGKGTTMTVYLPVADRDTVVQSPPSVTKPPEPPQGSETILIIGANRTVTSTAEHLLTSLGYVPVSHQDVNEAMAFLDTNAEDINLIQMDLPLSDWTTTDALAEIRKRCPSIPVVVVSGSETDETVQEWLAQGVSGVIPKPFSVSVLATTIREALDAASQPPTAS